MSSSISPQNKSENKSAARSPHAGKIELKGKLALITGATSGIGRATALAFAKAGCETILIGRRQDRLTELAKDIQSAFKVRATAIRLDVSDRKACAAAYEENQTSWNKIDVLVNNAGLARGTEPLQKANLDDFEEMIDANIKGLLFMTRPIAAAMAEKKSGHIVNMGSVSGRWVYPGGSVYCATKFSVRAITEGLRMDLAGTGVRVTNIEPGMVETEFSEVRFRDSAKGAKVYEGLESLQAEDIADAIEWCVTRPLRVNIQELVVFPVDQAAVGQLVRR